LPLARCFRLELSQLLCEYCQFPTLVAMGADFDDSAFTIPIFIRVFFVGNRFRPGPWNLGKFSIPIGIIASAFVALMVPILCLPSVVGADLT
jgi:hypothetical protein